MMIEATLQRRPWLGALLAAALALGLYAPTLNHDFVYDDHLAIEANPAVQGGGLAEVLGSNFWGPQEADRVATWRPAVTASFSIDAALARAMGLRPAAWMHGVNALLFALVCAALWSLCFSLAGRAAVATAAALLLASHPAASESVSWLVGRADLMVAAFGLAYLRAHTRDRHGQGAVWLLLAVASKETGLVLPVVAALYTLVHRSVAPEGEAAPAGRPCPPWWLPWLGPVAVMALWLVGRGLIFGSLLGPAPTVVENPAVAADAFGRVMAAANVFGLGARLLVLPVQLSSDYGLDHFPPLTPNIWSLLGILAIGGGGLLVWRWRHWSAGLLWLGLIAAPAALHSQLLVALPTAFAERLWLLPTAGLCGALAMAGSTLAARTNHRPQIKRLLTLALLLACALGVWRVSARLPDWRDDGAVYMAMVRDAPRSYRGLLNSAAIEVERGNAKDARAHLQTATAIHPPGPMAWLSLAQVEIADGQRDAGRAALEQAEQVGGKTDRSEAVRCAWQIRWASAADALATCQRAARPGRRGLDGERLMYLAMARDKAGENEAAAKGMAAALATFPEGRVPFIAWLNAGILFARQRKWAPAQRYLEQATASQPANGVALKALLAVCERHLLALEGRTDPEGEQLRHGAIRCITHGARASAGAPK